MAFLDSFGAKITSIGTGVSNKTKSMVEASNLNGQLKSCEDQLKNYYIEIGKAYYDAHRDDSDISPDMAAKFEKVEEAQEAINHLYSSLRKVKGNSICPNCRADMPLGTVFCSSCGNKMDGTNALCTSEETSGESIECPNCKEMVKAGAAFCINCGTKI